MWCCLRSQNFSFDKIFNVDNVLIIYFGRYKYLAVHVKYIILLSTILFKIYKTFRKLLLPPSKMQRIRVKPWPLLINPNTFEPTQHCSWVKSKMLRMMAKTWPLLVYTKNLKPAQDCSWVKGKMLRMREQEHGHCWSKQKTSKLQSIVAVWRANRWEWGQKVGRCLSTQKILELHSIVDKWREKCLEWEQKHSRCLSTLEPAEHCSWVKSKSLRVRTLNMAVALQHKKFWACIAL